MPSIQPVRLKSQALSLSEFFCQPDRFVRELTDLLDNYADHTYRPGQTGKPSPLLTAFNTSPPVLRQIRLAIMPLVAENPPAALALSDRLWQEPYLEHRLLAAELLGQLPISYKLQVIESIQVYLKVSVEERLIEALLNNSLRCVRIQAPQVVADLAKEWLTSSQIMDQQLGLRVLQTLAADVSFENLPFILTSLSPFLRTIPMPLRVDIIALLRTLIERTPPEVAYLFHQYLSAEDNSGTIWLIRQVINDFPIEFQTSLRQVMHQRDMNNSSSPHI